MGVDVREVVGEHNENNGKSEVIFFPESRGREVNYRIIQQLSEAGVEFKVKLHPSDSVVNYDPYLTEEDVISDFADAISNNICLARKSTVLLESLYNSSTPIAVLFDEIDRSFCEYVFPSLSDPSIRRTYNVEEFISTLTLVKNEETA